MKKEPTLYGIVGLLVGVVVTGFVAGQAVNNNNTGMMNMMGMRSDINSHKTIDDDNMSMSAMTDSLKNKTGDDFDKTFIEQMIIHHQGAIDMAKLAKDNAKHDEIKKLSDDILSAQSKEIDMMQTWQTQWGYKTTPSIETQNNMNH